MQLKLTTFPRLRPATVTRRRKKNYSSPRARIKKIKTDFGPSFFFGKCRRLTYQFICRHRKSARSTAIESPRPKACIYRKMYEYTCPPRAYPPRAIEFAFFNGTTTTTTTAPNRVQYKKSLCYWSICPPPLAIHNS